MSRSRPRGVRSSAGIRASAPQACALCDGPINVGDPIIRTRRGYAHKACAGGSDD